MVVSTMLVGSPGEACPWDLEHGRMSSFLIISVLYCIDIEICHRGERKQNCNVIGC